MKKPAIIGKPEKLPWHIESLFPQVLGVNFLAF
jgi:hypothetical protein